MPTRSLPCDAATADTHVAHAPVSALPAASRAVRQAAAAAPFPSPQLPFFPAAPSGAACGTSPAQVHNIHRQRLPARRELITHAVAERQV